MGVGSKPLVEDLAKTITRPEFSINKTTASALAMGSVGAGLGAMTGILQMETGGADASQPISNMAKAGSIGLAVGAGLSGARYGFKLSKYTKATEAGLTPQQIAMKRMGTVI